jgi:hypothetical protein
MDVIIFCGQSNMQGTTESRPIRKPVKNALEFLLMGGKFIPLNHPVGETFADENDSWLFQSGAKNGSLVVDFMETYVKRRGKSVAVHVARGDTTIAEWQKGTKRYELALMKIKSCLSKLEGKVGKIYLVYLQGESDAYKQTPKEEYKKLLTKFKNDLKEDAGIEKFGIIKVGYFASQVKMTEANGKEKNIELDERIMSAQEELVKEDNDFVMLTRVCTELSVNKKYINPFAEGHYNNRAMKIIGKSAAKALVAVASGKIH